MHMLLPNFYFSLTPVTRSFMTEYHMDCPRAVERLLRLGVPATVINPVQDDRGESIKVAETVQYFITAMDGVR